MSVIVHKDGSKTPAYPFGGSTMWGLNMHCKTCGSVVEDVEQGHGVYYHKKTGRCPNDGVQVSWRDIKKNRWLVPQERKRVRRQKKRAGRQARKMRP